MERIATVASECFSVNQNRQQECHQRRDQLKWGILKLAREILNKKAVTSFSNMLKDCLMLSVVIMIGAALTLILG